MPTNDSLDSVHARRFRQKAKSLLRSVREGAPDGLERIKPYFEDVSEFKLSQAQLVVARELQSTSWRALLKKQDWLSCSFCKKWQYDLASLIAGPDDVYVCDECVELCNQILRDQRAAG